MIKILFICHGNICRSPMAEFLFRDMAEKDGLGDFFSVASAAVSREEMGNPVHHGTRKILAACGISTAGKRAVQLKKEDYANYDYLVGMDKGNLRGMEWILKGDPKKKVFRLLDFTETPRDIADPWYTGDFDRTYRDIREGCRALLEYVKVNRNLMETGE